MVGKVSWTRGKNTCLPSVLVRVDSSDTNGDFMGADHQLIGPCCDCVVASSITCDQEYFKSTPDHRLRRLLCIIIIKEVLNRVLAVLNRVLAVFSISPNKNQR